MTRTRSPAWPTIALGVQVTLVAWWVAFMVAFAPQSGFGLSESAPLLAGAVAMTGLIVVGMVLERRVPGHPLAPILIVPWVLTTGYFADIGWVLAADQHGWPGVGAGLALTAPLQMWSSIGVVWLLFRFPTGRPLGRGWDLYQRFAVATIVLDTLLRTFDPLTHGTPLERPNPVGIAALARAEWVFDVLSGLYVLHVVAGFGCLITRYRRGDPVERQQLRWVAVAAAALAAGVAVTVAPSGSWELFVLAGAILLMPAAIGVAVLRYRLWDLGLIVRRAVVYTVLTGLLLTGYIGLVLLLRSLLPGLLPELLMTAVIAVVTLPLRELLQSAFDRILYGSRRDPYAVVRELGARLQAGAEPPLPMAVRELALALRLPHVAIVLPGGAVAARYDSGSAEAGTGERLPLRHGGTVVGELVAARRHPAEPLTPHDHRLLSDLAGHLGVAVHAADLDHRLRDSHARLLKARAEERTRIQGDLHDELGPLLGAASLRIQAARNLLGANGRTGRAEEAVAAAGADVARAMREIRRILADLQPSTLTEHGLIAALREHSSSWAGNLDLRLDLPKTLPPLDPVTEQAAYRIVVEALHNAERHSGGSTVLLRLRHSGGRLEIEVSDDGTGIAPQTQPGLGLQSMRQRAERLGGTLTLAARAAGGVRVNGTIPT
ncbi:GAF domain-containing sensor histidine kinase [Nonomuraea sp. M3C6]|uniref:GAF domain-containing sensor histidine kinase n=1 Tax=Nonomuraea marmarensis TaxID=3351344 RepID=A0ABW7AQ35_9ACTN